MPRSVVPALLLVTSVFLGEARSADGVIRSPSPWQVFQREGAESGESHANALGGPRLGFARVPIRVEFGGEAAGKTEWRVLASPGAFGKGTDWAEFESRGNGEVTEGVVQIPAGGWYRLELRRVSKDGISTTASVEPVGVGEVFLVAGQSYAAGANDEITKVEDPSGRVVCLDVVRNVWRKADDPFPNVGEGGTIWPSMGNALLPLLQTPVAFVNVAVGGTSSRQWLPGERLYRQLDDAGKRVGAFRAVLWQQGESDVIEKTSSDRYVENLTRIRAELAKSWGFRPQWFLAKSTYHPTVYRDPAGEARIRSAIDRLSRMDGFQPGPDTDVLGGENRGGPNTRRHFSGIGQRRAGLLWASTVLEALNRPEIGASERPEMTIKRTSGGVRYAVWGRKPSLPAPTLFVFATSLDRINDAPIYTEVGRILSRQGFVTVSIDPPCHGEDHREGEPSELAGWPSRLASKDELIAPFVSRASSVLDRLIQDGYADPNRIAACGTSRGGFLAYHFAAAEPRVKAVAGFSPVTDLTELSEFRNVSREKGLAAELNLVKHADRLVGRPIWVSIGNADARVSTDSAIAFTRAVVRASKGRPGAIPVSLIVGESVGHTSISKAHELAAEWISERIAR